MALESLLGAQTLLIKGLVIRWRGGCTEGPESVPAISALETILFKLNNILITIMTTRIQMVGSSD